MDKYVKEDEISYEEVLQIAIDLQESVAIRDELNEAENYDAAFEIECDQRDMGLDLADAVANKFNDYDTLIDENELMAEFLKMQGYDVEKAINMARTGKLYW